MLSKAVKQRIARNRKLRAKPKWVQKAEMYIHHLKTSALSNQRWLSTKHIADEAEREQVYRELDERHTHINTLLNKLALITREEWYEMERDLFIGHRWTPHQMSRTVKAMGSYSKVIEAHGGYHHKLPPKLTPVQQAKAPPMGNWDNPASLNDEWMENGDEWEADHGDPNG